MIEGEVEPFPVGDEFGGAASSPESGSLACGVDPVGDADHVPPRIAMRVGMDADSGRERMAKVAGWRREDATRTNPSVSVAGLKARGWTGGLINTFLVSRTGWREIRITLQRACPCGSSFCSVSRLLSERPRSLNAAPSWQRRRQGERRPPQ